jgi:16S rRNA (guanine527-N7)-methyltransferase
MDIGTGAGIPGVILAIAKPETEFILVDSTEKKINFINNFCEENGITNLKAVVSRAEELQEEVDMLTSRAVAALPKLLEISSHLVKVGGDIILYKGKNLEEEMCPKLEGEIEELGLKFDFIKRYELKENERTIIKYNKVKENKKGYPRT